MKIGFWQLERGHGFSTSNLAAVATYIALNSNVKSVIMQSQYANNNLMQCFYVNKKQGSSDALGEPGIDELIRLIMARKNDKEEIAATTYTFLSGKFNLLYETFRVNSELYYKDLEKSYSHILSAFENIYDITFIDIEAGTSDLSIALLKECDYVVYNLSQEKHLLNKLFASGLVDYDKAIFILGDYDPDSVMSYKNISRTYKNVGKGNLFLLPHCTPFSNAMNTTSVMKFINSNLPERNKRMGAQLKISKASNGKDAEIFIAHLDMICKELMNLMGLRL